MPPTRALRRCAAALAAALAAGSLTAIQPASATVSGTHLELIGHGWGHGRGMGQFGALGYAVNHGWGYARILDHFYGGTTAGALPNGGNPLGPPVHVHLTDANVGGAPTLVERPAGNLQIKHLGGGFRSARVTPLGGNSFHVETSGEGCRTGSWQSHGVRTGPVEVQPPAEHPDVREKLLHVCEAGGEMRGYRGDIQVHDGSRTTRNVVHMEDYLRGVVPRESPASWGDLGGGRGIEALRAQAVAARSYAWAENRFGGNGTTCDTISCQVYGGAYLVGHGWLEDSRTNQAISDTAGLVRYLPNGLVARTEFSSSTGGYSAGGVFPAVVDHGDSVSYNRNHSWATSIPVSSVESRYSRGRGGLVDVEILQRNGLGDLGGRVLSLRLVFSGGTETLTGDQFRIAFGLKSNWFTFVNVASFPYHVLTREGGIYAIGGAPYHGSLTGIGVKTPAIDLAEAPGGYWILGNDGGVFSFGAATFHGSMGGRHVNAPVIGMAASAPGHGYWLVAADGGIFSFGDAPFYGSTGNMRLNAPVVGMAPTASGDGYWMVATDGGIFSFGRAPFHGSTGGMRLNQPVFAMAPTPDGGGYWLVARDGGIFAFGNAGFFGSLPGRAIRETVVELLPSPSGQGYLIVTAEGRVHGFGDASSGGGPANFGASSPTVAAGRPR